MKLNIGIVMDPIESIKPWKDSSFAMMLAAQKRGWDIHYMTQQDLFLRDGIAYASMTSLHVTDAQQDWFEYGEKQTAPLHRLDAILMRLDPPFDMNYIYTTYLLERAEAMGCLIVNKPQSLRDANEKLYTAWFPQCCPTTLVSSNQQQLRDFISEYNDVIVKPLEGMGGHSIFRVKENDPNLSVILETMTQHGQQLIMAQQFIPEITAGDKRILLVDGIPADYALARIPAEGETRGNLAAGASAVPVALTARDRWICEQVAPTLQEKGLLFVGLDVIGEYITEINVTSPTCIRELDAAHGLDIAGDLMDVISQKCQ